MASTSLAATDALGSHTEVERARPRHDNAPGWLLAEPERRPGPVPPPSIAPSVPTSLATIRSAPLAASFARPRETSSAPMPVSAAKPDDHLAVAAPGAQLGQDVRA